MARSQWRRGVTPGMVRGDVPRLTSLNVENNGIGAEGMAAILALLGSTPLTG
jgi:hypothetical protein